MSGTSSKSSNGIDPTVQVKLLALLAFGAEIIGLVLRGQAGGMLVAISGVLACAYAITLAFNIADVGIKAARQVPRGGGIAPDRQLRRVAIFMAGLALVLGFLNIGIGVALLLGWI